MCPQHNLSGLPYLRLAIQEIQRPVVDILHTAKRVCNALLGKGSGHACEPQKHWLNGVMRLDHIHGSRGIDLRLEDRREEITAQISIVHYDEPVVTLRFHIFKSREEEPVAHAILDAIESPPSKDAAWPDLAELVRRVLPHILVAIVQDIRGAEADGHGIKRRCYERLYQTCGEACCECCRSRRGWIDAFEGLRGRRVQGAKNLEVGCIQHSTHADVGQHRREDVAWDEAPAIGFDGVGEQARRAHAERPSFLGLHAGIDCSGKSLQVSVSAGVFSVGQLDDK